MSAKKRIGYIDAMRGVTILLVVYSHIYVISLGARPESWLQEVFRLFRMPLFFFISGFIACTPISRFTGREYLTRLAKKAKVQLIPTVVFVTLFLTLKNHTFDFLFVSGGALAGYWFTVALFWMFVAYFTLSAICRLTSPRLFWPLAVAVSAVAFYLFSETDIFIDNHTADLLCLKHAAHYLMFFFTGVLFRRFLPRFTAALRSGLVTALLLALFALAAYVVYNEPKTSPQFYWFSLVAPFCGLLFVVALFQRHAAFFERDNRLCRTLRFLGRRTLDIYLLHYFFLPDLHSLRHLVSPQNCAFEFPLALIVVGMVVAVCMLASTIIRNSSFLAHWLFGAKKEPRAAAPAPAETQPDAHANLQQSPLQAAEEIPVPANETVAQNENWNNTSKRLADPWQ